MFDLTLIGETFDIIGKIMVSYTAIRIHYRFWKEHKVDEAVFAEMKNEQAIGIIGILLMIAGYVFHLIA